MLYRSRSLFERVIIGSIIYNARNVEEYIQYLNEQDNTVAQAISVIEKGQTYPKVEPKKNNNE